MGALSVFVIAGEPSGDALGAAVMAGLQTLSPGVRFQGVGGPMMQGQGLVSQFDMSELSLMGIAEVLPKYVHLKRRIAQTARAVIDAMPDVLITIDSPDFCLRVAGLVKAKSTLRTVHYVAPTVWAWRPKRAAKMARVIDHVLALFPFEPPFMEAVGMECDFVGHPAAIAPLASGAEQADMRRAHGLEGADPLMLVLPGSRQGEVARMGPVFAEVSGALSRKHPDLQIIVPAAPSVAEAVKAQVATWPVPAQVIDIRGMDVNAGQALKRTAFAAADVALATSGTVALELAAAGTPMVSAFDFNWLSRAIVARLLITKRTCLINLVTDSDVVPEVTGYAFNAQNVLAAMQSVLADPSTQAAAMDHTMDLLGRGGEDPGIRAARAVLNRL